MHPAVDQDVFSAIVGAASQLNGDDVVPRLVDVLAQRLPLQSVVVHLIDYRLKTLRVLATHPSNLRVRDHRVTSSVAGQVFRTQRSEITTRQQLSAVRAPITLRGQRIGILTVSLSGQVTQTVDLLRTVESAADALAVLLRLVGEGSDRFEVARRSGRLSVAAEMQWQLLPGTALLDRRFALAGHLEPAQRVGGDAFDWARDTGRLWISVVRAAGIADSASLACTLVITALRNARRAQLPLHRQVQLASDAVWSHFRGDRSVQGVFLLIDHDRQVVTGVQVGGTHLLRQRNGQVRTIEIRQQPALGSDEEIKYKTQRLPVASGDRLLLATEGVIDAPNLNKEPFGHDRLVAGFRDRQGEHPGEVVRLIVSDLLEHADDELPTDASVVCMDWHQQDAPAQIANS